MNWLNPVNWIKRIGATVADAKIDETVTLDNMKIAAKNGVNYCIALGDDKVSDEQVRKTANGLIMLGESLANVGKAIHPDGEEGRKFSDAELANVLGSIDVAFGQIVSDEQVAKWRNQIKARLHSALGVA